MNLIYFNIKLFRLNVHYVSPIEIKCILCKTKLLLFDKHLSLFIFAIQKL